MGIFKKILSKFQRVFTFIRRNKYRYNYKGDRKMKINIISDKEGWILKKFSSSVFDQLKEMGYDVELSYEYKSGCDINHYFRPGEVGADCYTKVDNHTTFMITHVDTQLKLDEIIELTKKGAIGICMSLDTKNKLIAAGVKPNKICYINPAQDGMIKPRKVTLGITHRVYSDNRKRESMLIDICKRINTEMFKFVIMGAGWDNIITELNKLGVEVEYYPEFDKQKYNEIMVNLDYYCYFGTDEGSMGYLDAVAAGIGTIVTPQGYHLDTECPITYPVETVDDIVDALHEIEKQKEKSLRFIDSWTWKNYTLKHLEIWKYMLQCETLEKLLANRGNYTDGIFSLMLDELNYRRGVKEKISEKENN